MPFVPLLAFFQFLYRFFSTIWHEFRNPENPEFRSLLTLVGLVLAAGTIFYHSVEGWSWLDSLYFSVTTLTTVGYGDLSPHTNFGKIFTMLFIMVGLGILAGFINVMATHVLTQRTDKNTRRKEHKEANQPQQ